MPDMPTIDYILAIIHKYPVASVVASFLSGAVLMYVAFYRGYVSTPSIIRRLTKVEAENKTLLQMNEIHLNDVSNMQSALDKYRKRDAASWEADRRRIRELEEKIADLTK